MRERREIALKRYLIIIRLGGPSDIGQRSRNRDPAEFVEARIDIRRLAQFLSGQQVNPSKIICSECVLMANNYRRRRSVVIYKRLYNL